MTSEWWQRVEEVFAAASACPPHERDALLRESCAGDSAMREEVEALLAADECPNADLQRVVSQVAASWADDGAISFVGQQIGRYRIVEPLGSGGMGEVFLAEDAMLHRKVALKLLPRQFTSDRDRLRRFEQEARAASALNHPNIITIYEIGDVEGTRFIATEHVDGETLRELIGQPLELSRILEIGCQAASALEAAHNAGIVHRDVKPANIMLRRDGYIKVLDFGLAKLTSARAHLDVTEPGRVMGTINYMSPEQAMGQPLDHRTDLFSLGVVLYELAAGRRLFEGKSEAAVYNAILNEPLPSISAGPPELEQVLRRALQKDPAQRYQSAADFRADLRRLAQGSSETEAARVAAAARRTARRVRSWRIAAATTLVIGLAAALFFSGRFAAQKTNPPAAPVEIAHKSIAVLPFLDLSPEKDQEYFSDGVAEEILNALARVEDLKVAGRTSSFSFKGKSEDARAIGAALGVAHILEGSLRRSGDKLRITAQLVQTSDGFRLWSESYDAAVDDVFTLQERIARAITDQLAVILQGEQAARLVKAPTTNIQAYTLYLQATAIFNRRDSTRFPEAFAQLQEAIRIDPQFARAHARLASLYVVAPLYDLRGDFPGAIMRETRRALELDPTLAEPHAALGQSLVAQRRFREATESYERALALEPNDVATNFWYGNALNTVGYIQRGAELTEKVLARDPMLPNGLYWRGRAHTQVGAMEKAEPLLRRAAEAGLSHVGLVLAQVAQARGNNTEAIEWLTRGLQPFTRGFPEDTARLIASGAFGKEAERSAALAVIDGYLASQPAVLSGVAPFALLYLDQPARALAIAQDNPTTNDSLVFPVLWSPPGRTARRLPEFAEFARRSGLAEFWDTSGPPDQCRKNATDDYICE